LFVGRRFRCTRLDLYEQCSLHITLKIPSSVSEGVRPRAARMRSYSCAVMPCWASNCGVTVVGSGTTAEESLVIVDASIVAWESRSRTGMRVWKARCNGALPAAAWLAVAG